jgi:hypothetical protein
MLFEFRFSRGMLALLALRPSCPSLFGHAAPLRRVGPGYLTRCGRPALSAVCPYRPPSLRQVTQSRVPVRPAGATSLPTTPVRRGDRPTSDEPAVHAAVTPAGSPRRMRAPTTYPMPCICKRPPITRLWGHFRPWQRALSSYATASEAGNMLSSSR